MHTAPAMPYLAAKTSAGTRGSTRVLEGKQVKCWDDSVCVTYRNDNKQAEKHALDSKAAA